MDHPFLQELSALLQETEKLLASAEPDAEAWESYARMREETFARLESAGSLGSDSVKGERAALGELINAVLERDRLLVQKLEACISLCRKGLSSVPRARQAINGYLPPRPSSFVERQV
jgi:hypothetical protein